MLKGVPPTHPDAGKFDTWSGNIYDLENDMAFDMAKQRVDAERKRKSQFEELQKAFQNIGMEGVNVLWLKDQQYMTSIHLFRLV